jgi:hypothetical protein
MKLYGAIDLHSTNNVTVVINEQDQVVYQTRFPNGHGTDSFLGQEKLPGAGDRCPYRTAPKALNLMTVQPEADQPKAETGADLRSDTN